MSKLKKPELLAPAGNPEKLKTAILYGADAVYLGTPFFGLRKYAENFTLKQLALACDFCDQHHKKIYLVVNGFAHNEDLAQVETLFSQIQNLKIHGLIISDLGIFEMAKAQTNFPIHISTQANITNSATALFWQKRGAKRLILARELSIAEAVQIKQATGLETEVFIHGSRCAGYSGQCLLSNYSSARDANRGGCVQNCRHFFNIYDQNRQLLKTTQLLNTKDLMTIDLIPQLITAQIDSLKIEGRMKSTFYLANTVRIYRQIIDQCFELLNQGLTCDSINFQEAKTQLTKVTNRGFTNGFLDENYDRTRNLTADTAKINGQTSQFIGIIKEVINQSDAILEVKNPFKLGDTLKYLHPDGRLLPIKIEKILNMQFQILEKAKINQLVILPNFPEPAISSVIYKM